MEADGLGNLAIFIATLGQHDEKKTQTTRSCSFKCGLSERHS